MIFPTLHAALKKNYICQNMYNKSVKRSIYHFAAYAPPKKKTYTKKTCPPYPKEVAQSQRIFASFLYGLVNIVTSSSCCAYIMKDTS